MSSAKPPTGSCTGGATLDMGGATHPGLVRTSNQDAFAIDAQLGLAVVADGLGGHAGGAVASRIAVDEICMQVRRRLLAIGGDAIEVVSLDASALELVLASAVVDAHAAVVAAGRAHQQHAGMAATVVAMLVNGSNAALCWVGDASAWVGTAAGVEALTQSHNLLGLIGDGPRSALITQALGTAGVVLEPGVLSRPLAVGEVYLLCSDGITADSTQRRLQSFLKGTDAASTICEQLITEANRAGGRDNSSVAVIRIERIPLAPIATTPSPAQPPVPVPTRSRRWALVAALSVGAAVLGAFGGWFSNVRTQATLQAEVAALTLAQQRAVDRERSLSGTAAACTEQLEASRAGLEQCLARRASVAPAAVEAAVVPHTPQATAADSEKRLVRRQKRPSSRKATEDRAPRPRQ